MIWIKRILFLLLLLLVLAGGIIGFITWKYADQLKNYALQAVHETITTEATFDENVVFSLWKDFPLVAVEISDIQIEDAFKTDTLLKVEKAFVQFDIIKILQNNLSIEGIRVTDGFLKLRRNEKGEWNFRVWKEVENTEGKQKIDFSIEILTLQNIHLDYDDRVVDLNIQFLSDKSKIKGRFVNGNTRLSLSLNGFMERLTTIKNDRIVELPLRLAGVLNINSIDNIYTIEMGNAILAGNEMVLDAEWTQIDSGTNMEMKVHAGNIEPFVLLPHIWPQMPENIKKLNLTGRADLIFTLNGPFTKDLGPQLNATIRMRDGGLVFQKTDVSEFDFEGKLFMKDIKRSKALEISFDSFNLKTPNGSVNGKGTLTNLSDPRLRLSTSGTSRIEEILAVANVEDQVSGNGGISWSIDFEGPLGKEFNTTTNELKQMRWSGNIEMTKAFVQFKSDIPAIEDLNGNIEMTLDRTTVKNCSGKIGHLLFDGELEIARLKEILTNPNSSIELGGNVHIVELDVQKLPNEWKFESESSDKTASSRPVSATISTTIDKVVYDDFTATNVSGNLNMMNEKLHIDKLSFDALGGSIRSNLTYQPNATGYVLNLNGELRNIDMTRALAEWHDFGQTSITSKNLKGRAAATLDIEIHLDKDQQLISDKLQVESDIEISGGELIRFEPLLAMSRFISVDELNHVKFDTLRNQLSIKNSTLFIPKMSISSNILNVQVFGQHGFNQEMDYHVNLLLNDLLRRKSKKQKPFEGHEIIDEKGKTRLFLWVRGKPDDIKVGFDKREVKQKLKADFKKEGQTIKQLFKEEFGGKEEQTEEPQAIQFKLEEEGNSSSQKQNSTPESKPEKNNKKKKKGFFSSEPEETETEGGFEIEFEP